MKRNGAYRKAAAAAAGSAGFYNRNEATRASLGKIAGKVVYSKINPVCRTECARFILRFKRLIPPFHVGKKS